MTRCVPGCWRQAKLDILLAQRIHLLIETGQFEEIPQNG